MDDFASLDQAHGLHPWTHFDSFNADGPLVIDRGEGVYLWDAQGRQFLDAVGGLWCTQVGLGRREIAQAMAAQAERLAFASTFVDMSNPPMAALSAKLAALAPGDLNRVHFTTGGSTAIDSAFRTAVFAQRAMGHKDRVHCIARQHSYHGSTYASMSLGLRNGDRAPEFLYQTDTIHHVSAPYVYRPPLRVPADELTDFLVAELEAKIAELGADRVAAFFAEPLQASGGVLVPPDDYLRRMAEVCRRHGVLFVADEVVTGFGRLGAWFVSQDVYGAQPDILCCAKGLSSGYAPIGAMILSERLYQAMGTDPDRWFTSGFTYSGHPVACAASLANLEIIEREGLLANAQTVGAAFQEGLRGLSDLPLVGDVRGREMIACVENVADKTTKALLPEDLDVGRRVSDACEARGLFVRPMGHLNVMSPPLTLTEEQAGFIVDTLGAAITEVADGLVRDGVRLN